MWSPGEGVMLRYWLCIQSEVVRMLYWLYIQSEVVLMHSMKDCGAIKVGH